MNDETVLLRKRPNENFFCFLKGKIVFRRKKFNTEPVAQTHESTFLVTEGQPGRSSSFRGLDKAEKEWDLCEASLSVSLLLPWQSPASQLLLVRPAQLAGPLCLSF